MCVRGVVCCGTTMNIVTCYVLIASKLDGVNSQAVLYMLIVPSCTWS